MAISIQLRWNFLKVGSKLNKKKGIKGKTNLFRGQWKKAD